MGLAMKPKSKPKSKMKPKLKMMTKLKSRPKSKPKSKLKRNLTSTEVVLSIVANNKKELMDEVLSLYSDRKKKFNGAKIENRFFNEIIRTAAFKDGCKDNPSSPRHNTLSSPWNPTGAKLSINMK